MATYKLVRTGKPKANNPTRYFVSEKEIRNLTTAEVIPESTQTARRIRRGFGGYEFLREVKVKENL